MKFLCAILLVLFCVAATSRAEDVPPVRFSIEHMDLSVDPGTDFYRYASGYWIKNNPIPADQSAWVSFVMVDKRNWQLLRQIMESSAALTTNKNFKTTATNLNQALVGEFYRSAMDTNRLEKLKFKPLEEEFHWVNGIGSVDDLIKVLARLKLLQASGGSFFDVSIEPDEKNTSVYTLAFSQGGLGLPEREYYLSDSFAKEREAYVKFITDLETMAGEKSDKAAANAKLILEFETALAKASRSAAELRDPVANYNKFKVSEAVEKYPNLKLRTFLKESGRPDLQEVVIRQTNFFAVLDKTLKERPLADLKTYLHWHVLRAASPYLHETAEKENFKMYSTVLAGTS
jgi:putative endopeptidase